MFLRHKTVRRTQQNQTKEGPPSSAHVTAVAVPQCCFNQLVCRDVFRVLLPMRIRIPDPGLVFVVHIWSGCKEHKCLVETCMKTEGAESRGKLSMYSILYKTLMIIIKNIIMNF